MRIRSFSRDKRTLLDKMLLQLGALAITSPYYFVADAYYAAGKIVTAMLRNGHHLISRARSNATA